MSAVQLFSSPLGLDVLGTDDHVLYKCSCDYFKPITKLYFCRHCTKLRCSQCISHEVDSYYCPNCLENMPSAEAKIKKNRCGNCFDCPSCGHTLSVRATAVLAQSPTDDPSKVSLATAKKMHYLMCSFCRWSSRDVNLPDQPTASGGWPELDPPAAKQIASLLDYYKQVAHQEKMEKEKKKLTKRKAYFQFMDRHGLILSPGKKRAGSGLAGSLSSFTKGKMDEDFKPPVISEAVLEVDPIPDSFTTDEVVLDQILTVNQRLAQLGRQPASVNDLYPRHKQMLVRRSQRCRECEHNLSKPEFNPSSIKFKLHLGACLYIPRLRVANVPSLEKDKRRLQYRKVDELYIRRYAITSVKRGDDGTDQECPIVLSVTNPLDNVVDVTFMPLTEEESGDYERNSTVAFPNVSISLAAKDATNEFDDMESSTEVFQDDPSVIQNRHMNKVWFYAKLTPHEAIGDVKAVFKMKYDYKAVVSSIPRPAADATAKKEPPGSVTVSLEVIVTCKMGEIGDLAQASLAENKLATFV